jgi:site-specific DNA recombinase
MGRLTLNVLLSFAQFERELASERVRDKVAASRKKGKWTGGTVPLGYDAKDKKLIVNKAEAEAVRTIFRRYLELKSFSRLVADLDKRAIVTKRRNTKVPKYQGGIPFTYGPLAYLLENRAYLGETRHGGKWFNDEHEAIIDCQTFEQVQHLLKCNAIKCKTRYAESDALLKGKLFDDNGNRMGLLQQARCPISVLPQHGPAGPKAQVGFCCARSPRDRGHRHGCRPQEICAAGYFRPGDRRTDRPRCSR